MRLERNASFKFGYRCLASEVPDAIERLLRRYRELNLPGQNLRQFFASYSDVELRTFLAGETVEAVIRDVPAGVVPHGIEG